MIGDYATSKDRHIDMDVREKSIIDYENIPIEHIDPFSISNTLSLTMTQLLKAYLKLRTKNHPDRGGDNDVFILIMNAINTIKYILKNKSLEEKNHHDLKQESALKENENSKKSGPIENTIPRSFNIGTFNNYFTKGKFIDEEDDDVGYGDIMEEFNSKKTRENLYVKNEIGTFDQCKFKDAFESKKKEKIKSDMIVYQIPRATNDDYIGDFKYISKKNNNFTNPIRGYTDYKQAFEQPYINVVNSSTIAETMSNLNENLVDRIKRYKNERLDLTNEQTIAIEQLKINNEKEEYEEKIYLEKQTKRYREFEKKNSSYPFLEFMAMHQ